MGAESGRHQLQGSPRRLQPATVSDGQGAQERAHRVLLLRRRRATGRHALGAGQYGLEGGFLRTACTGQPEYLGEPLHMPAITEDLQPADGPLRASGYYLGSIQRLGREERLPDCYRDYEGIDLPSDLRQLSA